MNNDIYEGGAYTFRFDTQSTEAGADIVDLTGHTLTIKTWVPGLKDPVDLAGVLVGTTIVSYKFASDYLVPGEYRFQTIAVDGVDKYPCDTVRLTVKKLGT